MPRRPKTGPNPVQDSDTILRFLVVSREMSTLRPLWSLIERNSWELETVSTGWEALERVQSGLTPNIIVLDLARGDTDSLHILRWLRRLRPQLPILLFCHPEDESKKSEALRMGADAVLVKPFGDKELEFAIYQHLRGSQQRVEEAVGRQQVEALGTDGFFVSTSPLMRKVASQAELLAEVDVPVFIVGEAGSGKEEVARLIHRLSVRSGFNFLKVNCVGIPGDLVGKEIFGAESTGSGASAMPGKIEMAAQGTILLSEVTGLPSAIQAQLLNLLCNGRYARIGSDRMVPSHARILLSSGANLEHALPDKLIREDLYHRASAFSIHVPPLRQRREEIPILLGHFMQKLVRLYGLPKREIPPAVVEKCQNYSWPGNLDELETFVKRYIVSGDSALALNLVCGSHESNGLATGNSPRQFEDCIDPDLAPTSPTSLKTLMQSVKSETEKTAISMALEKTRWNRKAAARLLSVSYRTLLYKIEQYHLSDVRAFSSADVPQVHFAESGKKPQANRLASDKH